MDLDFGPNFFGFFVRLFLKNDWASHILGALRKYFQENCSGTHRGHTMHCLLKYLLISTYIMNVSKNNVPLELRKKYCTDMFQNRLKLILMCLRSALALRF